MKHVFTSDSLSVFRDISNLSENVEIEFKAAEGQDGKGSLPKDFYETYSAFANTNGGFIFLGAREKKGRTKKIEMVGVSDPDKLQKELWDCLNNPQKVSINLLQPSDVLVYGPEEQKIVVVRVPRAKRNQKPVFVGSNPYKGTFRRQHEGDYLCPKDVIDKMFAERAPDSQDSEILIHYDMEDIDVTTLKAYRNNFKNNKPDHPFNDLDDLEFLERIGAWDKERETGKSGLTLAGLLMFGQGHIIQKVLPAYSLDYQERADADSTTRWTDRLTLDGTWSGNLYDFFRRVIQKLFSDLKVPFVLEGSQRVDDTPVHKALREALVNSMIHADYKARSPILVIKRPDLFGFENPGLMRIPIEEAKKGGQSDCRNLNLQKMFQLVGYSDKAGLGIPLIFKNWKDQHWYPPVLLESTEPEKTILLLKMVSLIPDEALKELRERFGENIQKLPEAQILALATVVTQGFVTHAVLKSISKDHSRDLTRALQSLVKEGYLESGGKGSNTYYYFKNHPPDFHQQQSSAFESILYLFNANEAFEKGFSEAMRTIINSKFELFYQEIEFSDKKTELPDKGGELPDKQAEPPDKGVELPDNGEPTTVEHPDLWAEVTHIRETTRGKKEEIRQAILSLCEADWRTPKLLKSYLGRDDQTIRDYIKGLQAQGYIESKFPAGATHPGQAYRLTAAGKLYIQQVK